MTKKQFENLEEGDFVILNGMCRHNSNTKCRVIGIFKDCIWVKPIVGEQTLIRDGSSSDWNEISYKAANIL